MLDRSVLTPEIFRDFWTANQNAGLALPTSTCALVQAPNGPVLASAACGSSIQRGHQRWVQALVVRYLDAASICAINIEYRASRTTARDRYCTCTCSIQNRRPVTMLYLRHKSLYARCRSIIRPARASRSSPVVLNSHPPPPNRCLLAFCFLRKAQEIAGLLSFSRSCVL